MRRQLGADLDGNANSASRVSGVTGMSSTAGIGRVLERRRAVALARHYREFEGLSIRQIADRLGRSPATVKAYFYDPTGEKARAVKARYVGRVPRLRRVHPAAQRQGRRLRVLQGLPSRRDRAPLDAASECSRRCSSGDRPLREVADVLRLVAHARSVGVGGEALKRLAEGEWPASSVVTRLFGTWAVARARGFAAQTWRCPLRRLVGEVAIGQ